MAASWSICCQNELWYSEQQAGRESWELDGDERENIPQLGESLKDIVILNAAHCVYMELRSDWVSFCAVFFHSVTRACTKKKRFFLEPNGYFTTEFPRRWKEALHIEPACKLQVTPPSRGRYQNKGPCEAEVSAGSGPQAAGSGPTPTKPVAPDFIDCAIQKT
jgi:hypothetical protein